MKSLPVELIQHLVRTALAEDIGAGDVTTECAIPADTRAQAVILAKEPCVVAGSPLVAAVFTELDSQLAVRKLVEEGSVVAAKTEVCRLTGLARPILTGERTALNFLQR